SAVVFAVSFFFSSRRRHTRFSRDWSSDVCSSDLFLNVLREIGANHTVIFSTHIVDDVRELCNEIAILNGGKILFEGTPTSGEELLEGKIWRRTIERAEFDEYNKNHNIISSNFNPDNTLNIRVHSDVQPNETFIQAKPILEDVYFVSLKGDI